MQPLASLKALGDPIYETFYGLHEQPFAITTDPKFFYLTGSHERAFSEIANGLRRREGVLLLTGDTGTGKTTLCRAVIESLGKRTFSAMILNPYMSGAEVFRIVLRDFGLVTHDELRRGALANADVPQLLDTLEGFLRSLVPLDSHAVIVLDEAQSVAPQVLDQIRLLTALEHDNRRLVQIVLCGQPGLLDTLKLEPMQALNERITRRVTLAPFSREQVRAYIEHRLRVAGGASVSFDAAATKLIAELSHGLPRRINVLCDRALQEGRIDSANVITADIVKRAARSLAGAHEPLAVIPDEPTNAQHGAPGRDSTDAVRDDATAPGSERAHVNRRVLYAGAVALVAVLLGVSYGLYARSVISGGLGPLPAPGKAAMALGEAVPAAVPPTDEELRVRGMELRWPSAQQLPDNSNQLY